ncbi:MAG: hypothetical protein IT210_05395 [Armatimonadetes bacterium]|nr:hypothetical protein [Armatimonadota bacterium]
MHPQQILRLLGKEENPPPTRLVCHSSDYANLLTVKLPDHVQLTCSDRVRPGAVFLLREASPVYLELAG